MPACLLAMALALLATGCESSQAPRTIDAGRLGAVKFFGPLHHPRGLVFLFSDEKGWNANLEQAASRLAGIGAAVVVVDLPRYLDSLAGSSDGCHYVIAEIEELSHRLERETRFPNYRAPVLAGIGGGATLVYAALAQAPAATIAGATGIDPAQGLTTRVPLCPGAPATPDPSGGFRYATGIPLPGPWHAVDAKPSAVATTLLDLVTPMLEPPVPGGSVAAALSDLPVVEIPAHLPDPLAAVIYSGDGGWRDLDKTIGEALAERGVPVIGVDSLRYFWWAKSPERVAADLSTIFATCRAAWGDVHFIVIGYSFGAGILPFAVNRLSPSDRSQIVQVSLLGLEPRAPFQIEVKGWLQQPPSKNAPPVRPEVERLDPARVQCFYGAEETESLCRDPVFARSEVVRTSGGHHFDGNYVGLADRILEGARRRMAAAGSARRSGCDDARDTAGHERRDVGENQRQREAAR
jgi:type IV secretory pathway VirJ component